tara:strand:+ start:4 stop:666 length:663 start_codon:yes stop_codon:yes gene_type:complete
MSLILMCLFNTGITAMDVKNTAIKIMLDCSPAKIHAYRERYGVDLWQLRTPLTSYALSGVPYGLDNGCFKRFEQKTWERLLNEAEEQMPKFVCLPDIVGDAVRTLDLFSAFERKTNGLPRALVLQDGIGSHRVDWDKLSAVFVGGSDAFKTSSEAMNACRTAKMLGKWVHVGRVNTAARVKYWIGVADSIDGSGISKYDHMLENVLTAIDGSHPQSEINL